jgi:hypothetical protein
MIKDRWSPYLTANDVNHKIKKTSRSEVYALSKERKNITEQLQLMRVRIKQLEKEEKRAKLKAQNALELATNIIDRRVQKKQNEEFKENLKKIKEQEISELRERNKEMKEVLKFSIQNKKEEIIEKNKLKAKFVKDLQLQRKIQLAAEQNVRTASLSPRPSVLTGKSQDSKLQSSRIDEEKEKTSEALKEISKLEELEKLLIEKLRTAYESQKKAEEKVAVLINNSTVCDTKDLEDVFTKGVNK